MKLYKNVGTQNVIRQTGIPPGQHPYSCGKHQQIIQMA